MHPARLVSRLSTPRLFTAAAAAPSSLRPRFQFSSRSTMGVDINVTKQGNGADRPRNGDNVTIEYTGWLFDESKPDHKGNRFDSSVGRGDFDCKIGVGQVIKGWDEGVVNMTLGEKATLTISPDYGYGARGFPGHIPPNSTLIFDVELKGINGKKI